MDKDYNIEYTFVLNLYCKKSCDIRELKRHILDALEETLPHIPSIHLSNAKIFLS